MAEYWVDPSAGNDADPGTELLPWRTVPGMTGANAVVAGDVINVRSGTTIRNGRLVLGANNLTYRAYGMSSEVLILQLPVFVAKSPMLAEQRIVRSPGVHEGYVTIDVTGETTQGGINFSSRTGCVVEDMVVVNATSMSSAISIGSSAQAQIGATIRRCGVINAAVGVTNFRPNTLIEYSVFKDIQQDAIVVSTSAAQAFHAGNFNTIQYNNIINPGIDVASDKGDAIQLSASTGYQGTLNVQYNYIYKPSEVKQAVMMADIQHYAYIKYNFLDGGISGQAQIGVTDILSTGTVYVDNNYWKQRRTNGNPIVRIVGGSMDTGSRLYVRKNVVDITTHAGLFSWGSGDASVDGAVYIQQNTVYGAACNDLSWSANVGLQTAGTIGVNASATVENNLFIGASNTVFRLPTGGANDPRWVIRNNLVDGATYFGSIGTLTAGTNYDLAAFQAAHSAATNNKEEAALRPALEGAGVFVGYTQDADNKAFFNPPSIGAYEYRRAREIATTREVRS